MLEAGLSIASIIYGALLGVFLLGLLTRRTSEYGAMAGMVASLRNDVLRENLHHYRVDLVRPHRHRDDPDGRISLLVRFPQRIT